MNDSDVNFSSGSSHNKHAAYKAIETLWLPTHHAGLVVTTPAKRDQQGRVKRGSPIILETNRKRLKQFETFWHEQIHLWIDGKIDAHQIESSCCELHFDDAIHVAYNQTQMIDHMTILFDRGMNAYSHGGTDTILLIQVWKE